MLHKEHILTKQYGGITNKKENSQRCVKELNGGKMLNSLMIQYGSGRQTAAPKPQYADHCSMETRSLNLKTKDFKKHNHKTKT